MTWTPDQIITLAQVIFGGLLTIGGWFFVSKLNRANTEKAKAEAGTIYQKMANDAAENDRKQHEEIEALKTRIDSLQETVKQLTETNRKKDLRIEELNDLSVDQEKRIQELERSNKLLEEEIQTLRMKRK